MEIRCHRCSMFLCESDQPIRLVGIFKASLVGRVPRSDFAEVRKRCESCTWVNVFHPVRADKVAELKAAVS